jgi:hypothetical protein
VSLLPAISPQPKTAPKWRTRSLALDHRDQSAKDAEAEANLPEDATTGIVIDEEAAEEGSDGKRSAERMTRGMEERKG